MSRHDPTKMCYHQSVSILAHRENKKVIKEETTKIQDLLNQKC